MRREQREVVAKGTRIKPRKGRVPKLTTQERKDAIYFLSDLIGVVNEVFLMERFSGNNYNPATDQDRFIEEKDPMYICRVLYNLRFVPNDPDLAGKLNFGKHQATRYGASKHAYLRYMLRTQKLFKRAWRYAKNFLPGLTDEKLENIYRNEIKEYKYNREHVNKLYKNRKVFNSKRLFPLSQEKYNKLARQFAFESKKDTTTGAATVFYVNRYSDKYKHVDVNKWWWDWKDKNGDSLYSFKIARGFFGTKSVVLAGILPEWAGGMVGKITKEIVPEKGEAVKRKGVPVK